MKDIIINNKKEVINYIIIGILTTLVSLLSYFLLTYELLDPNDAIELFIANVISWILSVTFAYITNRLIVFKSENKNIFNECIKFYASRIFTLLLDLLFMFLFVNVLSINDRLSKIIVQFIIVISNYIISKFVVFKK